MLTAFSQMGTAINAAGCLVKLFVDAGMPARIYSPRRLSKAARIQCWCRGLRRPCVEYCRG